MVKKLYEVVLRIRIFEDICEELFKNQKIKGVLYTCHGEEAIAAGAVLATSKDDYVTTYYRGHGYLIAKGADPKKVFAEILGLNSGYCRGNGGTMHIIAPEINVFDYNAIVGAQILTACGLGFSVKYKKENKVVLCSFGDGATNTGFFHEGLNLAALWKLPVVFICHNNQYAESTPTKEHMSVKNVAVRAMAYGINSITIDGNDAVKIYKTTRNAVKRARLGLGPTLIECLTYRIKGHYIGDPEKYRNKKEVLSWQNKDPIKILEKKYKVKDDELKIKIKSEYENILKQLL